MKSYLSEDTIAAVSSALGGAVAIVRVSGPEAFAALARVAPGLEGPPEARKLVRVSLVKEGGDRLDDAMVACFPGPKSFTGEDVVEFHIHGNAYIASRLLQELGFRQALPGEFSFRAVRNGRMGLTEAQALPDLITAENDEALSLALDKLSGLQSAELGRLGEGLRQLTALTEVGIDFSDQDQDAVEDLQLRKLADRVRPFLAKLRDLEKSVERGKRLQEGVRVAIVGAPNVGKSCFFNALLGEDRSIVSAIAGTTRDVIRETLTLEGAVTFRVEDTAGLRGETSDVIEQEGMERTRVAVQRADLVLFLVDASEPASLEFWKGLDVPPARALGVLTKCDLPPRVDEPDLGISEWIRTSAIRGEGISEVARAMVSRSREWVSRPKRELWLTREDHVRAVRESSEHMERALAASEIDLFAGDLRQALAALAPLIGETPTDDILGRIFSEFCIGK